MSAKVIVRVMCTFDVEVEHAGSDLDLTTLAEVGAALVRDRVAEVSFGPDITLAKGTTPSANARRVTATLELQ